MIILHYVSFSVQRAVIVLIVSVNHMEDTIRKCKEAGSKNKISYKFRTGSLVSEIADEVKAQGYDMLVLTSSHIDSWIRSLFSDTRKIISNVTIPVLVVAA
jgi:nucleotide-binding universal stress UspA family protein